MGWEDCSRASTITLLDPILLWLGRLRRMFFFLLLVFTLDPESGLQKHYHPENESIEVSRMVKAVPLGSLFTTQTDGFYLGFLPSSGYWGTEMTRGEGELGKRTNYVRLLNLLHPDQGMRHLTLPDLG